MNTQDFKDRATRKMFREDIRKRLLNNPNPEVIDQLDTFIFHYMHERGFHNVVESMEISLQLFNKKRLIRLIQSGDFEKAISYLNQCKKFIRDAEFNTVMRRILYAYFPCLMLKGETARAMKLITDMENMGLYDQEAKLKYGDLLKFEKLSNVISREMVISKCAEVVTKDLENIEDHYSAEYQDIPTKYEKLNTQSLIHNISSVFNSEPPAMTYVGNTYQMVVENKPTSIWADYSREVKKKKRSYDEFIYNEPSSSVVTTTAVVTESSPIVQPKHKYSTVTVLDSVEAFKDPIFSLIHTAPSQKSAPKMMLMTRNGNNLVLKTFKNINGKILEVKHDLLEDVKFSFFLQIKNDLPPAYSFGVNTTFIEAVKDDKFLLFKLETDKYFVWDSKLSDMNLSAILVEKDTSRPLVGTFDGRLGYVKYESHFQPLTKLGDSPIVKIIDCSESEALNLKYVLAKNGTLYRVEITNGEILQTSIIKFESNICSNSNDIPELFTNPTRKTEVMIRSGKSIQMINCTKNKNGMLQFSKQQSKEISDLTCVSYSPEGDYVFIGKTNGEIQVVTTPNFLPRGPLMNTLIGDFVTCLYSHPENNGFLVIGTRSGKVQLISLSSTQ